MTRQQIVEQWAYTKRAYDRIDLNEDRRIDTVFGTCITTEYFNLLGEWYVYEDANHAH